VLWFIFLELMVSILDRIFLDYLVVPITDVTFCQSAFHEFFTPIQRANNKSVKSMTEINIKHLKIRTGNTGLSSKVASPR